jgi:F-type H+-transporting ATPase subunit gamma
VTQLIQQKQKIKSIETTKKITHAVRLVSMSFYARLEKQNIPLQYYTSNITQFFSQLSKQLPDWDNNILFPKDILDSTPLFILIASSKGLCGSFNSNLFRYFDRNYYIEEHQTPKFITIGSKATKLVREKNLGNIIENYGELTSNNFNSIAKDLVEIIDNTQPPYSSITFYSNYLKNFFIQKPEKNQIIPATTQPQETQKEEQQSFDEDLIWEQDKVQIINFVATKYLKTSILDILFQSLISETASRFLAMDSSTNNAEKMLETLTLQYNKARQALITQEVSELSATPRR